MDNKQIIAQLPYEKPFLFVDELESVTEHGCIGYYTFNKTSFFYKGHFRGNPITPGVILTECAAQIGVVCLGIYLMGVSVGTIDNVQIALSSHEMNFFIPVFPGETVRVRSEKEVFRFNKLKCKVYIYNRKQELVARGNISGMLNQNKK